MKTKKDLPLTIVQQLAPFVGNENELYYAELKNKDFLFQVFDKDINSDFHFFITEYKLSQSNIGSGYNVKLLTKPESQHNNNQSTRWIDVGNIGKHFTNWITLLKTYNETPSFFDDPILKAYEEEYFTEFSESLNNESKPFSIRQQIALDSLFEQLKIELTKQSEGKTYTEIKEIEDIKSEITLLQQNVSSNTKTKVVKALSKIYSKISKLGINFIKSFASELQKQVIKSILEGTFDPSKFIS